MSNWHGPTRMRIDLAGSRRKTDGGAAGRSMTVEQRLVRTNVRGEAMSPFFRSISITRERADVRSTEFYDIGVVGGSIGSSGRNDQSVRWRRSVLWVDHSLVIDVAAEQGPSGDVAEWVPRREVWTLMDDNRLRIDIDCRGVDVPLRTVSLIHRR